MSRRPGTPLPFDVRTARAAIRARFPEVGARTVRALPGGWDFRTLEVDRRWIFRFPGRPGSDLQLAREFAILPQIASAVGVAVPEYRFRHEPDRGFPFPFGGYRRLPGVRVDRAHLSPKGLVRAGRELGEVLTRLHGMARARAVSAGLPYRSAAEVRREYSGFGTRVRREVGPLLDVRSFSLLHAALRRTVRTGTTALPRTVVTHNDLLPWHVLVDPRTGALTGVIDWGDVTFGDPAFDLGWMGHLPHLGAAMYRAYGGPRDPGFRARADGYRRLVPAHSILYAIARDDRELRDQSVRHLARTLSSPGPQRL